MKAREKVWMNLALAVLVKLKILHNSLIHNEIKVQKVFSTNQIRKKCVTVTVVTVQNTIGEKVKR